MLFRSYATVLSLACEVVALSCSPSQPFPPPTYRSQDLATAFEAINNSLSSYLAGSDFDDTNVAIEVTSSQKTLWSYGRSALNQASQAGTTTVDQDTVFRVARVTKLLTTIAVLQLHDQGQISSLRDAITNFVPELLPSPVSWEGVTVWDLLNNMAGVVDMYGYNDVFTDFSIQQRELLGLPSLSDEERARLPDCQLDRSKPCDAAGLLQWLRSSEPVFSPHTINSNSNVGTSLLGIMISRITGMSYEEYIHETLVRPMNLSSTTFAVPSKEKSSILKDDKTWAWDVGINAPSVGLYSSPRDISTLLRWILRSQSSALRGTAEPSVITSKLNLFEPGFYAVGSHSLVGMPWNIFRSSAVIHNRGRSISFNTVVGTLGPYTSIIVLIPEYDLAFSLMLNGALGHPHGMLRNISTPLIQAADKTAWRNVADLYAGFYASQLDGLNSSLTLQQDADRGLFITSFVSNSTEILPTMERLTAIKSGAGKNWIFQLVPTFLYDDRRSTAHYSMTTEEEWRWTYVLDKDVDGEDQWNDWCLSSFDPVTYAGKPLTKVVFVRDKQNNKITGLRLSGWDVWLEKQTVIQDFQNVPAGKTAHRIGDQAAF